ncbi:MAG: tripartite tricarboxylate transporter TctB family protein [Hyphomicrobiales bacterium]|nr:tripartite tricarboxylate transporter TctB family protein [Hyphomicrobiales bacterium]
MKSSGMEDHRSGEGSFKITKDLASALVLSLLGFGYLIWSLEYDVGTATTPGPGLFPRLMAMAMALCGLLLAASSLYGSGRKEQADIPSEEFSRRNLLSALLVIGSIVFYLLVIEHVGFLIASSLLVFCLAWVMGGTSLIAITFLSVVSTGLAYWLFWVVMRVPIPSGSLWVK